jgi:catechol 2,3-dioxygenase-like lactoylglutathione lyase family enzyme
MARALPSLRQILLLQRDVPRAAAFYERALGLRIAVCTDAFAELALASTGDSRATTTAIAPTLALQRAEHESQLQPGYTPILHFEVDDVQTRVNAALALGGRLDGKIQYETHGAVACVRTPDGHMIGMYQRA